MPKEPWYKTHVSKVGLGAAYCIFFWPAQETLTSHACKHKLAYSAPPLHSADQAGPRQYSTTSPSTPNQVPQFLPGAHCLSVTCPHPGAHPPNRAKLPEALRAGTHDWVAITSPEAASVFLEAWREAGRPDVSAGRGALG